MAELWQCVVDDGAGVTAAFLHVGQDGRLLLSVSDTDSQELGLELSTADALELRDALDRVL